MAQTGQFKGTARRISIDQETGTRSYFYRGTAVVGVYMDGSIRLNSGNWRTATTKRAMNQASNQDALGFSVFQKAREWFVTWRGETVPFEDGMFLR